MLTTLSCIAVAVYFEARGESMLGQRAVAEVILNRVADPRWPETACEVIKQKNQFSFVMILQVYSEISQCGASINGRLPWPLLRST
jgi:spore germination cell wall hydrolase CwlJ-like protein